MWNFVAKSVVSWKIVVYLSLPQENLAALFGELLGGFFLWASRGG